jgi:hypothetical protein
MDSIEKTCDWMNRTVEKEVWEIEISWMNRIRVFVEWEAQKSRKLSTWHEDRVHCPRWLAMIWSNQAVKRLLSLHLISTVKSGRAVFRANVNTVHARIICPITNFSLTIHYNNPPQSLLLPLSLISTI